MGLLNRSEQDVYCWISNGELRNYERMAAKFSQPNAEMPHIRHDMVRKDVEGISAGEVNLPKARKFYAGLRQVACSDDAQLALRAKRPLRAQTSSWHSSRRCYRDVSSIAVKRRGR
jgi:hypothetical protein